MSKSDLDESEREIFNPFREGISGERWSGLIIIRGGTFDLLKWQAAQTMKQITEAKLFAHLPICGGGNSGSRDSSFSFNCLFASPVELQIAELRRKANELEKSLGGTKAIVEREY